ncbi:LysR family transcriptional regulator [Corallincola platygyrae]|uniref:LysR family transcriptional regulator n=1 Tax=Corallincola platygyrae TaxID=1193278 RepID=A0ABW4XKF8_9GAMM
MKHSDFSLFPIFVAVMEEQSLSKAAKRLNMSQPAVSQAINRLRELYDDQLFNRGSRGVVPTSVAYDLFPILQQAVQSCHSTLMSAKRFNPKACTRVFSLCLLSTLNYTFVPRLIERIKGIAPECGIEVHPPFTDDLEADLRFQRFDLNIGLHTNKYGYLAKQVLLEDELVVIARENHPRLKAPLTEQSYLAEKHVVHGQWHSGSSYIDELSLSVMKKRNVVWSAPGAMEMLYAVRDSEWLTIMPSRFAEKFCPALKLQIFKAPFPAKVTASMMWLPSNNTDPAHKWFREQCRLVAKDLGYIPK